MNRSKYYKIFKQKRQKHINYQKLKSIFFGIMANLQFSTMASDNTSFENLIEKIASEILEKNPGLSPLVANYHAIRLARKEFGKALREPVSDDDRYYTVDYYSEIGDLCNSVKVNGCGCTDSKRGHAKKIRIATIICDFCGCRPCDGSGRNCNPGNIGAWYEYHLYPCTRKPKSLTFVFKPMKLSLF